MFGETTEGISSTNSSLAGSKEAMEPRREKTTARKKKKKDIQHDLTSFKIQYSGPAPPQSTHTSRGLGHALPLMLALSLNIGIWAGNGEARERPASGARLDASQEAMFSTTPGPGSRCGNNEKSESGAVHDSSSCHGPLTSHCSWVLMKVCHPPPTLTYIPQTGTTFRRTRPPCLALVTKTHHDAR